MFYQKMLEAERILKQEIEEVEKEMEGLPTALFYCVTEAGRERWYQIEKGIKTYIPKSQRAYAELLALHKYYARRLKDLRRELAPIQAYLKKHRPDKHNADKLLTEYKGYTHLLNKATRPRSAQQAKWMQAPYKQNTAHPEHKRHPVTHDLIVRSKSEALIATQLLHHQIAFRYECALNLNGVELYPDFTICHPLTNEIYYWEHLGLIDRPEYKKTAGHKIQAYVESGILPDQKLILTAETQEEPLSIHQTNAILTAYFAESSR